MNGAGLTVCVNNAEPLVQGQTKRLKQRCYGTQEQGRIMKEHKQRDIARAIVRQIYSHCFDIEGQMEWINYAHQDMQDLDHHIWTKEQRKEAREILYLLIKAHKKIKKMFNED